MIHHLNSKGKRAGLGPKNHPSHLYSCSGTIAGHSSEKRVLAIALLHFKKIVEKTRSRAAGREATHGSPTSDVFIAGDGKDNVLCV